MCNHYVVVVFVILFRSIKYATANAVERRNIKIRLICETLIILDVVFASQLEYRPISC